ncbi:hypothetical protein [Streptomyces marianii]|uniref:Immunity protein 35 domain-containing protein n=1 Tax=Streptomyces marianii TaxID=1817406 RepID=A0A5R9DWH5_9ACTN|nr:hypothetical protein [Streptomyces marianii]TLQ39222.1 hypothetical protein FEF34_38130 [Streptomyces marianii]
MAITYEQARDRVVAELQPTWTNGTFCIDDRTIVENDDMYVFEVGAREYLKDRDPAFEIVGGVTVVFKEDGRVDSLPSVQVATDQSIQRRPNPRPTFG